MRKRTLFFRSLLLLLALCGIGVDSRGSDPPPDNSGPLMLSAQLMLEPLRTNRILIVWNERLSPGSVSAASRTNFSVVLLESNITVTVSNLLYNPSGGPNTEPITILTMSTTNWHYGSNYYIIANRVRDLQGNVIAPNSIIPMTWPGNQVGSLPPSASPLLTIKRAGVNEVLISWPTNAYSYALEWTTNIVKGGTNVAGPWYEEQPWMTNPYLTSPAVDTYRIYRLRKTQ